MFDITFTSGTWNYQEYQEEGVRFTLWGVARRRIEMQSVELSIETYNAEFEWWEYI